MNSQLNKNMKMKKKSSGCQNRIDKQKKDVEIGKIKKLKLIDKYIHIIVDRNSSVPSPHTSSTSRRIS